MSCPLCGSLSDPIFKGPHGEYHSCSGCKGIFLLPQYHLSELDEKRRYEKHNNDVNDRRYQEFVQPLVDEILKTFKEDSSILDYGCGNGPVISYLLEKKGFTTDLFDPYFHNDVSIFSKSYGAIILSEVMEHFNHPGEEFEKLFSLLAPGGKVFCLTELYNDDIDFKTWYYKNDETHVFFYHRSSVEYIAKKYGNGSYSIEGRMITF